MKKLKGLVSLTVLLVGASFLVLTSCKGKGDSKAFVIEYIKVWESKVSDNAVKVQGKNRRSVEVKVKNCDSFSLIVEGAEGVSAAGVATVEPVAIERGTHTLTITLKAAGFKNEVREIKVTREDTTKPVSFSLKRKEDEDALEITDKVRIYTAGESATLKLICEIPMQSVTVGGEKLELANEGKEATHTVQAVATGTDVEVIASFENYKDNKIKFKLIKVAEGEVPISAVSAKLFSGDVEQTGKENTLIFNDERSVSLELDDIEYSLVKLEMDFDANLSSRTIECDDGRSVDYLINPTEDDAMGKYAGYLMAKQDKSSAAPKELEPIDIKNKKKYTEYLVVGAGTAKFEITVHARDRQSTTYKVEIKNKKNMKRIYQGGDDYPLMFVASYDAKVSVLANGFSYLPLPCYHKGPYYKVNEKNEGILQEENLSDLEFVEDIKLNFLKIDQNAEEAEKTGEMVFYYNMWFGGKSEHGFIQTKRGGKNVNKTTNNMIQVLIAEMGATGKYLDMFLGFKDWLPQGTHPFSIKKPWKAVARNILEVNVLKMEKAKNGEDVPVTVKGFGEVYDYRRHVSYYKEAQAGGENNNKVFTIAKNMKWNSWQDNTPRSVNDADGDGKKRKIDILTGQGDFLALHVPCLKKRPGLKSKMEVRYTIKKGTDVKNLKVIPEHKDVETVAIGYGQKLDPQPFIFIGMKKAKQTFQDVYRFKEKDESSGEALIYDVEVTITLAGTTNKYIYRLDYRNEVNIGVEGVEHIEAATPSTSALFASPVSSGVVPSLSEKYGEFANMHDVWADFGDDAQLCSLD